MSTITQLYEALKDVHEWCDLIEQNYPEMRFTKPVRAAIAAYEAEQKARAENMANANTKDFLNQAAKAVHARLPDNYGFIVFAFPHNGGRMLYASNAERKGAVNALKEWLLQASGEEEWLKHIQ